MNTRLWSLAPIGLIVLALVGCAPRSETGLSPDQERYLVEIGMIVEGEHVRFFASSLDLERSGDFFTDRSIGHYWMPEDPTERVLERAPFERVTDVELTLLDSWTFDHFVTVTRTDGTAFRVYVTDDDGFATRFFEALQAELEAFRQERSPRSCCVA